MLDNQILYKEIEKNLRYTFTVFTPTFNRAHTLDRVYNSLNKQTFSDFEWIVVDDGSTDNTEILVNQWKEEANFSIKYFYQENSGKHVAINRGVREANGKFFLIFDSDDSCIAEALERFNYHWNSIPMSIQSSFSGVSVLCMDKSGNIVGNKYPLDVCDLSAVEMQTKQGVVGEKWGFHRTNVLREFPFPEIPGEKFISEGIVWNRIAQKYKIRHVNEMLRIYEYLPDGLSASSIKIRVNNPVGAKLYYQEFVKLPIPIKARVRNLVNYTRFSLHARINPGKLIEESKFKFLTFLILPLGYLVYKRDIFKLK